MTPLADFLSRKSAVLTQRREDFTANPPGSVFALTASSRVSLDTFARPTRMGAHETLTDSGVGLGGQALGPSAPEMLLGALASCLVHTYLIQAVLLNIPLEQVEVEVTGNIDMAGVVGLPYDQPPQMSDIAYSAKVQSSATADQLEHMHRAVEATCPVLNTIRYPVAVKRDSP
jgi:uncharacterized OsmC-like protein